MEFHRALSSGHNGAAALLNSAAVIINQYHPETDPDNIPFFLFFLQLLLLGEGTHGEVRGQLCGVGFLLYLYGGSRNQTLVTRLAEQTLYPLSHLTGPGPVNILSSMGEGDHEA